MEQWFDTKTPKPSSKCILYMSDIAWIFTVSQMQKKRIGQKRVWAVQLCRLLLELSKVPNDVFKKKYPNLFWLYIISNPLVVFSCMPFLSRAPANRNRLWRITTGSSAHHISAHERHPQCKPAIAFLVKYNRGCIPKSLTCKRKQEIHLGFGLGFEPLSFFAITQYFFHSGKTFVDVCGLNLCSENWFPVVEHAINISMYIFVLEDCLSISRYQTHIFRQSQEYPLLGPESKAVVSFGSKNQKITQPPKHRSLLLQIASGIAAFDHTFLCFPKNTEKHIYLYIICIISRQAGSGSFQWQNTYKPKCI